MCTYAISSFYSVLLCTHQRIYFGHQIAAVSMPGPGTLVDALAGSDNATALFCAGGGPRVTRQQLREQIHFVASSLKAAGVKAGDAVSISDTNTVSLRCTGLGNSTTRE